MKSVLLTMVQCRSILGRITENLSTIEQFVAENQDSDVICFPEMCLTGYTSSNPIEYSITPDHPAIDVMVDMAKRYSISIVFGYIEHGSYGLHLRQEIVTPSGCRHIYRKTHLGIKESKLFVPGDSLPVFDLDGLVVGLHLCSESHIPEISTTFRAKGAELILVPFANAISGDRRRDTWHRYLPARANDNGVYVAACSAVGDNGAGVTFGGGLMVIDPRGEIIRESYTDVECSISVEIGGSLPRDGPQTMRNISYFDRRRTELYSLK